MIGTYLIAAQMSAGCAMTQELHLPQATFKHLHSMINSGRSVGRGELLLCPASNHPLELVTVGDGKRCHIALAAHSNPAVGNSDDDISGYRRPFEDVP